MGGMYLTFKHFMKSPVCNSKARCDKLQNSELRGNLKKKEYIQRQYPNRWEGDQGHFKNLVGAKPLLIIRQILLISKEF